MVKKNKLKEIDIVFRDGFPLINIKPEWKYEIEKIEKDFISYKKVSKLDDLCKGFILGILFQALIGIVVFFLVV